MPGDKVTLTFDGLYRGVDKVSGIFNPTQLYLNYSVDGEEFKGQLGQYQQMDRASVTLTIPEDLTFPEGQDKTTVTLDDGYISGGMYSASSPFDTLYNMTDTGVGTNFSAVSISFVASCMTDVSIEVSKKVYYKVKLEITDETGAVEDAAVVLTGSDGKAIAPEADGTYKLGYGKYSYSVEKLGYVRYASAFTLGSADAADVVDNVLIKRVELVKAGEGAWDGKTFTEPAKDESGVYLIGNGAELAWFARLVNNGGSGAKSSAILTADIDLAAYEWTPIGMNSYGKKFAGSFDGQNHTIRNLSIQYAGTNTQSPYKGLFGYVSGENYNSLATIQNLTVQGSVTLTSNRNVAAAYSGGIIARADYANLTNLHSEINVTVNRVGGNWDILGGVVGQASYGTTVKNCSNSGNVTGWRYVAGIVGSMSYNSSIIGCFNSGKISAPSTCAAGIVANLGKDCKVVACYNTGNINAGGNYPAGIVGYCDKAEVRNCFNVGNVTCNTTFTYGAVIGTVSNADAVIKNLYYLDGTCLKGGIGFVKNEEAQKAAAVSAETLVTQDFLTNINAGLEEAAFKLGCAGSTHPLLLWQSQWAHSFTNKPSEVLVKEATCTDPAVYYVKCDNCDAVSDTLTVAAGAALGHDYTDQKVEPTCDKDGYTEHACTRCGHSYRDEYVKAKGHSFVDVVVPATCEAFGYTTHTCSVCGDSYVDDVVKALGHSYEEVVTAPTCDKMGYTTHTCKVCGSAYVDSFTDALDHDFVKTVTKEPTCTEEGEMTFTCAHEGCGETYTQPIPKADHKLEETKAEATCTEYGYTTYSCKNCDYSYVGEIVQPKGHDWDEGKTVLPANCVHEGMVKYTCAVCGESKIETVEKTDHVWDEGKVTKEPTAYAEGEKTYTCTVCGETRTEAIAKLGTCDGGKTCPSAKFTDVSAGQWYHEAVDYAVVNGLFAGTSDTTFSPNESMTRGMLVTVLWRLAGKPEAKAAASFQDVDAQQYYAKAVAWAAENGIVAGTSDTTFSPNAKVTREQMAAILYRYAKRNSVDVSKTADLKDFPDADKVASYAKDAMAWAVESGIISGTLKDGKTYLDPTGSATRAQVASILMRYAKTFG